MRILKSIFIVFLLYSMLIPISAMSNETIDTNLYSNEDNFIVDQQESELALFYDSLPSKTTRVLICDNGLCEVEKIEISGITTYYQNGNQSWSNTVLNGCSPLTIGQAGCAITSFAMIASKYGSTDNPGQVNTKLGSYASSFNHDYAAAEYGLTVRGLTTVKGGIAENKSIMRGTLLLGTPLMVTLAKPGGGNHFVVVKSYIRYSDGSYRFGIKDPTYNKYNYLDQYMKDNYTIYNIRKYYK